MSAASRILDRLTRVRQIGPARWLARCPGHEDRSPSLSIRELDDGRVLVHDFGGCEVGDVLATVGLTLADLFPQRLPNHTYPASSSRIPARDLLEIICEEVSVIAIVAADLLGSSRTINPEDWQRLCVAARRINRARDYMYG